VVYDLSIRQLLVKFTILSTHHDCLRKQIYKFFYLLWICKVCVTLQCQYVYVSVCVHCYFVLCITVHLLNILYHCHTSINNDK